MKRLLKISLTQLVLLVATTQMTKAAPPEFILDPLSDPSVNAGQTMNVGIYINTGGQPIEGLIFNANITGTTLSNVSLQTEAGTAFDEFANQASSSQLMLALGTGPNDPGYATSTNELVATLSFTKPSSGSTTLTLTNSSSMTEASSSFPNILNIGSPFVLNFTSSAPTLTPTATPIPTSGTGGNVTFSINTSNTVTPGQQVSFDIFANSNGEGVVGMVIDANLSGDVPSNLAATVDTSSGLEAFVNDVANSKFTLALGTQPNAGSFSSTTPVKVATVTFTYPANPSSQVFNVNFTNISSMTSDAEGFPNILNPISNLSFSTGQGITPTVSTSPSGTPVNYLPTDFNQDGYVDGLDYVVFFDMYNHCTQAKFNQLGDCVVGLSDNPNTLADESMADINDDGIVDALDYTYVYDQWTFDVCYLSSEYCIEF